MAGIAARGSDREPQRLDFAQLAVRLGEHQAMVLRREQTWCGGCFQPQDVALQRAQHASRCRLAEALAPLAAVAFEQQLQAVAPQRAPVRPSVAKARQDSGIVPKPGITR